MYCHVCGNQIPESDIFCQKCGAPVWHEPAAPEQPSPVASSPAPIVTPPAAPNPQSSKPSKPRGLVVTQRNVSLLIVALVILLVGSFFVSSFMFQYENPLTNPAVGSSTTSSLISSTLPSSSGSNNNLAIVVSDTILDLPDASSGSTIYIYNVTLTDNSQSNQYYVDELYFTLLTNINTKYTTTFALAENEQLSGESLSHGQNDAGEIAYEIPNGQTPSTLQYNAISSPLSCAACVGISETINSLPSPSLWVSELNEVVTPVISGSSNVDAEYSIQNSTFEFLTGQTISVQISFTNLDFQNQTAVNVSSIAVSNSGFTIASISPSLPVSVPYRSSSSATDVIVNVVAPASSYDGSLNFTVTATG